MSSRAGYAAMLAAALVSAPATADEPEAARARLEALERQYQALRQRTDRELARLAREIDALRSAPEGAAHTTPWTLSGDFRLRYEHTTSTPDGAPSRDRGVLRARLGADYTVADSLTLGGRIVTGDPDDPNSADITLGDFTDDLQVSLDRAYVHWGDDSAFLVAGKFANPLTATDLVWDGDVNPQGVAGRYRLYRGDRLAAHVTGLYAVVDEQPAGADSDMTGGQLGFDLVIASDWAAGFDVGYYDYAIGSLANADAGDIRDNRLNAAGTDYLSDFDLLDVVAEVSFTPPEAWPVTVTADYVKNLGAADGEDSGYAAEIAIGRLESPGDFRFGYGYAVAETDAVFAAYSHDNLTYATNYRLHALSLGYVPSPHVRLDLTGYRYRRHEALPGTDDAPVTRVRLNWSLVF